MGQVGFHGLKQFGRGGEFGSLGRFSLETGG
jgi:hypothetical protein